MDIGSESDLLPPLFDQVVENFSKSKSGSNLRAEIVKLLFNFIEEAAAHENNSARTKTVDPTPNNIYLPLSTYDRLSGQHITKSAIVDGIAGQLGLPPHLVEIAILMIEAHIDLALATQSSIEIRGIEFKYKKADLESNNTLDHISWTRSLHEQLLKGITTDNFFRIGKSKQHVEIAMLSQGLLVGSAFRLAAPMEIKVPDHAVDYIIDRLDKSYPTIRLLQISDLHFGEDMLEKGGRKIKSGLMATHSVDALVKLGSAVQQMDRRYDVLLATGDLSTHGSRQELLNAQLFITGKSIPGHNPYRIVANALKASKSRRVLLPGNHDRYGPAALIKGQQVKNTLFEDILGLPKRYPYIVGFRHNKEDPAALTVIFFVFDSTPSTIVEEQRDRLAMGEIREGERSEIREFIKDMRENESYEVTGLDGEPLKFDPKKAVLIALLHHHPLTRKELSVDFNLDTFDGNEIADTEKHESNRFQQLVPEFYKLVNPVKRFFKRKIKETEEKAMRLEESYEFIKMCHECGIQMVLFGHRHEMWGGAYEFKEPVWTNILTEIEMEKGAVVEALRKLTVEYIDRTLTLCFDDEKQCKKIEDDFGELIKFHFNRFTMRDHLNECRLGTVQYQVKKCSPKYTHYLCCPSSLEYEAKKKGFYVLDILDEQKVRVNANMLINESNKKVSSFTKVNEVEFTIHNPKI